MHFRNTRIPRYIQNYLILPNEIFSHLLSIFIISYIYIVSKFYKISKEMYVFFFFVIIRDISVIDDSYEHRSQTFHVLHQFKTFSSPIIQITARALARKLLSSRGYKTFPCRPLGGPFFTIFPSSLIVFSLETL